MQGHIESLDTWGKLIREMYLDEAAVMHEGIEEAVWDSGSFEIQTVYALYGVGYFRRIGDNAKAEYLMKFLEKHSANLPIKYAYDYFFLKAIGAMNVGDYKAALRDFLYVEYLSVQNARVDNHFLLYNIAVCLTQMDYGFLAEKYIKKARESVALLEINYDETRYEIIEGMSYMYTARSEKAIEVFNNCLERVKNGKSRDSLLNSVLHNIGCAFLYNKKYDKAIENFNAAIECCETDGASPANDLYFKARTLLKLGETDKAIACLEKGIETSKDDLALNVAIKAIKCSLNLESETSLGYIVDIAIPTLISKGRHLEVMGCCLMLHKHFSILNNCALSDKYLAMSNMYQEKIIKGEICREEKPDNTVCFNYGRDACFWKCADGFRT